MSEKSIDQDAILSVPDQPKTPIKDIIVALILALFAFISIQIIQPFYMGMEDAIILLSFIAISFFYVRLYYPLHKSQYAILLFAVISCIPNVIYHNYVLKFFNFVFVCILMFYFILSSSHKTLDKTQHDWILYDFFNAAILLPMRAVSKAINFLTESILAIFHLQHLSSIFLGCILAIPLLFIIIPLLSSADSSFATLILSTFQNLDELIIQFVYFIASLPIFLYLYSILYGCVKLEKKDIIKTDSETLAIHLKSFAKTRSTVFITTEIILILVYAQFLAMTCRELLSNQGSSLLVFSYSEFARQGFFELCTISLINLLCIIGVELFAKNKSSLAFLWVKRVLCIETIFIIFTAMSKMLLYIHAYGLTELRIYSSWFMIILLGIFLFLLFFKKDNYMITHIIQYACVCFFILNMINIEYVIETYNTKASIEIKSINTYKEQPVIPNNE